MRHSASTLAIVVALATGFTATAQAVTVFDQSGVTIDGGDISDFDTPRVVYDGFYLAEETQITNVTWRGFYAPDASPLKAPSFPATDNFSIVFFSDTGSGGPAALGSPVGTFNVGDALRRDTGKALGSQEIFDFSDNLGQGVTLPSGTYWISIINQTTLGPDWSWASGSGGGYLTGDGLNTGTRFKPGRDTYFILGSNPPLVPAPAAFPLLASGIGMMGLLAWRRRRPANA